MSATARGALAKTDVLVGVLFQIPKPVREIPILNHGVIGNGQRAIARIAQHVEWG